MRYRKYLIVILLLISNSCKHDSNPLESEAGNSLSISGTINSFNGNFQKVYSSSYPADIDSINAETIINADGSFRITIPTPEENLLSTYYPHNSVSLFNGDSIIYIDSLQFHDKQLKYNHYDLYAQSEDRINYALPLNLSKLTYPDELAKVGDYFITILQD